MRKWNANIVIYLSFILLCWFTSANAQSDSCTQKSEPDSFLTGIEASHENSYVTFLGGIGDFYPLVFEVSVAPYYMIRLHSKANWGIEVSPKITVRMFQERSFPVRTPSYMPKINFYYGMGKSIKNLRGLFMFFSWTHHSNGQKDSFFNPDSITINTLSGNFATNYIEFGPFLNRKPKYRLFATDYFKVTGEYHYKQNRELEGKYGNLRLNFEFQSMAYPRLVWQAFKRRGNEELPQLNRNYSSVRLSFKSSFIFGDKVAARSLDLSKRINTSFTMSFRPKFVNDLTLFVQYYYGQDYYNIYFSNTISVLRFGIQADTFRLL